MKLTTVRRIFKTMILPGLLIVGLLFWDYFGNHGRAFTTLLWLAILYIIVLALLLLLPIEHQTTARVESMEPDPMSTHYPPAEASK